MRTVKAKDLKPGDTIEINLSGSSTASVTEIDITEDFVFSKWDDGLEIELAPNQEFDVLD